MEFPAPQHSWWGRLLTWGLILALVLPGGILLPPPPVVQAANAARIFSISPACAGPGDQVTITGNGFGSQNVIIHVGGTLNSQEQVVGGLVAQLVSANGNHAVFIIPTGAPSGVTVVYATNPGGHTGSIGFRVQGPEICGNGTDDNCNGIVDDPATCTPVNHAPVANAGPDQTAPVGTTIYLNGTASSDPDGNPLTFAWSFLSKPRASTATLTSATTVTPTFVIDKAGSYTVQLTVSDGQLTSTDTVVISTSNSAPVANAGPDQTGQVGTTLILDGSGSSDIDGNPLTYQWSIQSAPSGSTATLVNPTTVHPTLTLDVFGAYVVQLLVNDGLVNSAADTLAISTINTPPVADAGPDKSGQVGTTVTLDGSHSYDVDGNALTYQWSLTSKPATSTALLAMPTTPTPNLTLDKAGTYVAQLVVNDGIANSTPDTATISTVNSPPVANAGPAQSGTAGMVIHLDGSNSSDVDGNALTYQWSFASTPPGSTALLQNATTVTPSFTLDKPGTYIVQLLVNDGTVNSSPATTTITTLNSKPMANAGPAQSAPVGTTVTLTGSASSDVDGDPLTFFWSLTAVPTGSTATLSDPSAVQPTFGIDKAGTYTAQLIVNDGTVDSAPVTVTITTLNSKPVADAGPDQQVLTGVTVQLDGSGSQDVDGNPLTYFWSLTAVPTGSTATLSNNVLVNPTFVPDLAGTYVAQLIVNDGQVDSDPDTVTITVTVPDTTPPAPPDLGKITVSPVSGGQTTITGTAGSVEGGAQVKITNTRTNQTVTVTANSNGSFSTQLAAQTGDSLSITATDAAGNVSSTSTTTVQPTLPPDPVVVAPPIDRTIATTVAGSAAFLYSGTNPIQTGVAAGTIEAKRIAVLRGRVLKKDTTALSGVTLTILSHPEFGQTLSRSDGKFDLAVNGGGVVTVNYAKSGYLPAQRQIQTPWQDYATLPDVILIPVDTQVTALDLTASTPIQVARGTAITDSDGTRQATLLVPQGTTATMVLPDGSTQPLTTLNVRLTEYTVGSNGPQTMPAQLPPTSAYTYAVEISADQALAANAKTVQLSQPISLYVDNFLNFPVGMAVPTGAYDRQQSTWVPQPNGKVLKLLSITGGAADIDSNGDGVADDAATLAAVGITPAEQQQLAQLYPAGRTFWRIKVARFSSYDGNWGGGPPADAIVPNGPAPGGGGDDDLTTLDEPDTTGGGAIAYQNQALRQQAALVGTPFTLHYTSDRIRGRASAYTVVLPLSGASLPASVQSIILTVDVAGQHVRQTFPAQANLSTTFTWDGKDAYGRLVQGRQPIDVITEYVYSLTYQQPATVPDAFGEASGLALPTTRAGFPITLGTEWTGVIGAWDARALGLGGWMLDVQQAYDPIDNTLYLGEGSRRSGQDRASGNLLGKGIQSVIGNGTNTLNGDGGPASQAAIGLVGSLAISPDGSVYLAQGNRVRKVDPMGIITTVAGGGINHSDGIAATQAFLQVVEDLDVGPDGSLYIVDRDDGKVRKVSPSGIITTVAGNGQTGLTIAGDGGPAPQAVLPRPTGIAVAPDGSFYIADVNAGRIRKVSPDGIITTIAGTGGVNSTGDGGPATQAQVSTTRVALGADGSLYIVDRAHNRLRRVGPNGIITTVAGTGASGSTGDGGLATAATFQGLASVTLGQEGSLFLVDGVAQRIRRVDPQGRITTVAGTGAGGFSGEGGPATAATLPAMADTALAPDGSLYISENLGVYRVRRVRPALPGFSAVGDFALAAKDGSEVYVFNPNGKHLRTVNPLTNSVIYSFGYDSTGQLSTVTDANNNVTTIQRDASGNPTAIVGPYGQSNTLTLDANGNLASLTNPNGETTSFAYTTDGLLTSATPPGHPASSFTYDSSGRVIHSSDPAGGSETLTRTNLANGYQVQDTTATGTQTTYKVEFLPDGQQKRTNTMPDGTVETTQYRTDGGQLVTQSDGITQNVSLTGDPRFGLQSPLPTSLAVTTPGGKNGTLTNARTVNLSDPNNPLSLTSQSDTVSFNGRNATRTYNAATRTSTETSPAGRIRTTVTDTQGRVSQQQQGNLAATAFSYDSRGRLSSRSQGGRSTSLTYDTLGRPQTITDSAARTVQFQYDSAGRVTQQTLPDTRVISYSYDGNGNVTSITPPGRPAHSFTYTAVDLEKDYLAPAISGGGTNTTTYSYNADRQVTGITRPDGQQVTLSYNGGKLRTQTFPTGAIAYGYNAQGNLSSASFSSGGTVNYTYDGSLLLSSTWSGPVSGSVTWTYDNNYRKTAQSVNGGNTINFSYDNDDLLTAAGAMTLTRDAQNGLLTGTTLGVTTDSMTYNSLGEVAMATSSISGSPILTESYTRDSLGRISTKTETIQGTTTTYGYTYDTAGRLTEVKHNGNTIATYAYDQNANRLSKTAPGGTLTGSYDAQDRLLTYNGNTYTYTANGELATVTRSPSPDPTSYAYDALGNLRSVTLANGTTLGYVIDGENRRIGKTVNGTLVQGFLYENQLEPVAELDGSGNLVSRFVYCGCGAGNIPQYMVKGGVTYRILSDHLGSPRLVIDVTSGAIVQRMDYDEFGNVILDTNPGFQPFGFAGGIYDRDTGLVRHGARDYDPETGRWTAKDPIRFDGGDSNFYGYVASDPINAIDPTGLETLINLLGATNARSLLGPGLFAFITQTISLAQQARIFATIGSAELIKRGADLVQLGLSGGLQRAQTLFQALAGGSQEVLTKGQVLVARFPTYTVVLRTKSTFEDAVATLDIQFLGTAQKVEQTIKVRFFN